VTDERRPDGGGTRSAVGETSSSLETLAPAADEVPQPQRVAPDRRPGESDRDYVKRVFAGIAGWDVWYVREQFIADLAEDHPELVPQAVVVDLNAYRLLKAAGSLRGAS
jgi:hypothetical protein